MIESIAMLPIGELSDEMSRISNVVILDRIESANDPEADIMPAFELLEMRRDLRSAKAALESGDVCAMFRSLEVLKEWK